MSDDSRLQKSFRLNRAVVQWVLLLALAAVAVAYFIMPVGAQEEPPGWAAELWAGEGGEELVAVVYARLAHDGEAEPALIVVCGDPFGLRYDPGPGGDESIDWLDRSGTFAFNFGGETIERDLQYQAMDATFAAELESGDPLLGAIEAGSTVTVSLPVGGLPDNRFSLKGSKAAIGELRADCR